MAKIFPCLENIERLKVPPTPGEIALATSLAQRLSDDYEIFFQPFLNGDMPDIILMRRGAGVAIIEVKDWNLSSYSVDDKNQWRERAGNHVVRSPFKQVFGYKSNMFNLHINGLAEKNALNNNFLIEPRWPGKLKTWLNGRELPSDKLDYVTGLDSKGLLSYLYSTRFCRSITCRAAH
ncbi:nuclease-related domain-containing protein [Candidatus Nitronereus thalassa]|uniref:Nuclease-related domain-containing protein n=1 Tax=Candidatus Nitronereus thalassa TaxID=3020898 RepID=A0ABU3K957_9BACT|nr:nuclease-related domain-containing protein [Candidatus Nitronereus thalassa]MDT7042918.1 nuclease-related domain-containing protein [Candidatus Nitronereus thalassa]